MTITAANTVIDGYDITGQVNIEAANVTIKNSRIHSNDYFNVQVVSGNVLIEDSELYGAQAAAVAFDNWTAIRVNVHDVSGDGFKVGDNSVLQDSYIHDFVPTADAHADGLQMSDGAKNVVIKHNSIDLQTHGAGYINSALFIVPEAGGSTGPITITNNLLGGGGWTVYLGSKGTPSQTGITFTGNHFVRDYGYGTDTVAEGTGVTWSGNVWQDNGAVVNE